MVDDKATGATLRLGLSDDAFGYSLQGDGLTPEIIGVLDQLIVDVGEGGVEVPVATAAPVLVFDGDGNDVDGSPDASDGSELSFDGFEIGVLVDPGSYEIAALGTPLNLSFEAGWASPLNVAGHTVFTRPDRPAFGDGLVVFLRPHVLADPHLPQATEVIWPLDDIEGWLDEIVDGIATTSPRHVEIGGRDSVYFEAEITDPAVCGSASFCVGFIANTVKPGPQNGGEGVISGWGFVPGLHHRIWWIDQGTEAPLVIVAVTPTSDRTSQAEVDALLDTLIIGDPQPHPVPFEESGLTG